MGVLLGGGGVFLCCFPNWTKNKMSKKRKCGMCVGE